MKVVRDNLKIARDRHKRYTDNRRRDLQFETGDRVFLKISPWKGVLRFGRRGKLSQRFIRPYEIVSKVGLVAYKLKLPPELSRIHDTFHVDVKEIHPRSFTCVERLASAAKEEPDL